MRPDQDSATRGEAPCTAHAILISIATALLLAPFLGKAYHIDDPLFLWVAQQIRAHPLDFYGFDVNWYGIVMPMHEVTQNPPLASYFIALNSLAVGWSELGQHVCFLLPAIALSLGIYTLAARLCSHALLSALIAILTPVFAVCSSSIMCDVPMMSLWLWSVIAWENGLRRSQLPWLLLAALLIAAAALTKYFGAALIPLLLAYSIAYRRGVGLWICWLVVPVLALVAFEFWTKRLYGHGLLAGALDYPQATRALRPRGSTVLMQGLAFTGGCMLPALFFAPLMWSRGVLGAAIVACGALALAAVRVGAWQTLQFTTPEGPDWLAAVQAAALIITGVSVLAAAAVDLYRRRDAGSVLLAAWVAGTFVFATYLNWSVTARTLLPMAPAVAILIVRRLEDRGALPRQDRKSQNAHFVRWTHRFDLRIACALLASAVIAMAAAWSDHLAAAAAREAAHRVAAVQRPSVVTLWFMGHWGWQHYLQEAGAKPLDFDHSEILPGDVIAVADYGSNIVMLPAGAVRRSEVIDIPTLGWLTVFHPLSGAGFHSSLYGPLPLVVDDVPPERFEVFVARDTIRLKIPTR